MTEKDKKFIDNCIIKWIDEKTKENNSLLLKWIIKQNSEYRRNKLKKLLKERLG